MSVVASSMCPQLKRESVGGGGDKNPAPELVADLHRQYYSQENELHGFQGSASDTGSGGPLCFCVICGV